MSRLPTLRGLSLSSADGNSTRAARPDWVEDNFRCSEPEIINAAIRYLTDPSAFRENCPKALGLYVESDLDKWERRTSGALLVGSNRPLLTRFIKGDDLKNQAAGTVRTINAHFTYLNLSQLMAICQRSMSPDYYKSSIAELRDLSACLEEALAEKLMSALLQLSDCFLKTDEEGSLFSEVFSLQERKYLGRRLLFVIGALALPNVKGSSLETHTFPFDAVNSCWFIYGEASANSDVWGFYLRYPELRISLKPPSEFGLKIHSLIENRSVGIVTAGSILTWHILSTTVSSGNFDIQDLIQHGASMKSSTSNIRGSTNKKKMGDRKLSSETIGAHEEEELDTDAPETPSKDETEEEEEEWGGPVEFDEAVPTYYDLQQETYFYYGNILYYDPDYETYYYYDWDQENYMYIDDETLTMINDNTIPCWNAEDGQYYDASIWAEAAGEDETAEVEVEISDEKTAAVKAVDAEQPAEQVTAEETETETSSKVDESKVVGAEIDENEVVEGKEIDMAGKETAASAAGLEELRSTSSTSSSDSLVVIPKGELPRAAKVSAPRLAPERFNHSIDQFRSSEGLLINRAMKRLIKIFDDQLHLLDEWAKRANGTLRVGRNRRAIVGLINGSMELKSLSSTECADVASNLALLNLAQLLYIRINAQNSAWDKSPVNTHKTFAMKTDSLIAEKFVVHILEANPSAAEDSERTRNLLAEMQPSETRHAGSQAIFIIGALPELRTSQIRILGSDGHKASWWFLSISPFGGAVMPKSRVMKKPLGIFLRLQLAADDQQLCLRGQFDPPSDECTHVYKLVAGRGNAGFVTWDILEIAIAPTTS